MPARVLPSPIAAVAAGVLLAACADFSRPALFPLEAAGEPVVQEQALIGLAPNGDAAVVQLVIAESEPPRLTLLRLPGGGGGSDLLATAPQRIARAVAEQLMGEGARAEPLLAAAASALWPEAQARAKDAGLVARPPPAALAAGAAPLAGSGPGRLPLSLRFAQTSRSGAAEVLLLSGLPAGSDEEVELARMPLAGRRVVPQLWLGGGTAWMLAGSVAGTDPLRRTVGLRRADLGRGEAELHLRHARADVALGELPSARRELDRALAAAPRFIEALYAAAAFAAVEGREEDAVGLLGRAAASDPRRLQVLGRDDPALRALRRRADVRAMFGLSR